MDPERTHLRLVLAALGVLGVLLVGVAVFATDGVIIVAYSSLYVLGVIGFWVGYAWLSRRAPERPAR